MIYVKVRVAVSPKTSLQMVINYYYNLLIQCMWWITVRYGFQTRQPASKMINVSNKHQVDSISCSHVRLTTIWVHKKMDSVKVCIETVFKYTRLQLIQRRRLVFDVPEKLTVNIGKNGECAAFHQPKMDGFLGGRSLTRGVKAACFVHELMNGCLNQYGNQSPAKKEAIICHARCSMRSER